jgi:hypothetical protein
MKQLLIVHSSQGRSPGPATSLPWGKPLSVSPLFFLEKAVAWIKLKWIL